MKETITTLKEWDYLWPHLFWGQRWPRSFKFNDRLKVTIRKNIFWWSTDNLLELLINLIFRKRQFALNVSKMLLFLRKNTKFIQEAVKNRHWPRKISQTGKSTRIGRKQRKMSSSEIFQQMYLSMISCAITVWNIANIWTPDTCLIKRCYRNERVSKGHLTFIWLIFWTFWNLWVVSNAFPSKYIRDKHVIELYPGFGLLSLRFLRKEPLSYTFVEPDKRSVVAESESCRCKIARQLFSTK